MENQNVVHRGEHVTNSVYRCVLSWEDCKFLETYEMSLLELTFFLFLPS